MPEIIGNTREFRAYLVDNWQRLYRAAYAWTHDRQLATDLVQETVTRAMHQRGSFPTPQALNVWLYKVLANCLRDHYRVQKKVEALDEDVEIADNTKLDEDLDAQRLVQRVRGAVGKLNREQREVVTLVALEGFSYREVADILDIPIGTVMSRLCRSRANLKQMLDDLRTPTVPVKGTLWRVK